MEEYVFKTYAKQGSTLPCFCYNTVQSTNLTAKEFVRAGDAPRVFAVVARGQSGGRGRYGRHFLSAEDKGVFVTYARRIDDDFDATPLGGLCALCVCDLLGETFDLKCGVKWPNDVQTEGKKICGILPETVYSAQGERYLLLGTGVNLFYAEEDFGELASIATSATLSCKNDNINRRFEQNKRESIYMLGARLAALNDDLCEAFFADAKSVCARYAEVLVTTGKNVTFQDADGRTRCGVALGTDERCALVVECSDGVRRRINWGEVTVQS